MRLKLLILLVNIQLAMSIRCFTCNGTAPCEDPFDRIMMSAATWIASAEWCWKVKYELSDEQVVIRGLHRDMVFCRQNQCQNEKHDDQIMTLCCCNTDLCNDASRSHWIRRTTIFLSFVFIQLCSK